MKALTILKEQIPGLNFVRSTVSGGQQIVGKLLHDLERAMIIGNSQQGKVKIVFESDHGKVAVETTVWAATDNYVSLKGGISIPMSSIHEVVLY